MRTRGWQTEIPGDQIPNDGPNQRRQQNVKSPFRSDQVHAHAVADGFRHPGAENQKSYEVEECSPHHRDTGRQYSRRYHGRDRVRRVMKAVDVIKNKSERDEDDNEGGGGGPRLVMRY